MCCEVKFGFFRFQIDRNLRHTPLSTRMGTDFCTEKRKIFLASKQQRSSTLKDKRKGENKKVKFTGVTIGIGEQINSIK